MIVKSLPNFLPIGGYQPQAITGDEYPTFRKSYYVDNPHGEFSLSLIAFDMWDVPASFLVDSAIGKVPLEMKIYMDRPSCLLPPVVDCGMDETDRGKRAWVVLDDTAEKPSESFMLFPVRKRQRNLKVRELLEPLHTFVSEIERMQDWLHGGGIYDLGVATIRIKENGESFRLFLKRICFAASPNQAFLIPTDCWRSNEVWGCLAPEMQTPSHDCRADVFALARSLAYLEQGTFWQERRSLLWKVEIVEGESYEEALRRSCDIQISKGLENIRTEVLEKALAFNPDDRYQSLSDFIEDLSK